jgi:spectrin beta
MYLYELQDCEELTEWVQEKNITAQDETYRSAKTVHSKWTRHQAFEAEIASNKDRLYRIQEVHKQQFASVSSFLNFIMTKFLLTFTCYDTLVRVVSCVWHE